MSSELRVALRGPTAELGVVAAADVARLLLGVERAVARAAAGLAGRQPGLTGRRGSAIEASTRLRFRAVEAGSVAAVLDVPDATSVDQGLPLTDPTLGVLAAGRTLDVLDGNGESVDVAAALSQLAEELGIGFRHEELIFTFASNGTEPRRARLDGHSRRRLRELVERHRSFQDDQVLSGVLVEADFERRTARLRTVPGDAVLVAFDQDLDDSVQEALRHPAELEGRVLYDGSTGQVRSVDLHRLVAGEQLILGVDPAEFWGEAPVSTLRTPSGDEALSSAQALNISASEEEVDTFLEALGT